MPTSAPGAAPPAPGTQQWLLLIHQVPAKPDYARVKVRRRLRRLGAVALTNAVYVLPRTEGATDAEVEAMFNRDRDADYAAIAVAAAHPAGAPGAERPEGRTWVTRAGVHVDRIASAWLIRRFIDPAARFRFVAPRGHPPAPGELRFDMFEAEYTHEGARCTFETLLARFALDDPALVALGQIVHDIDVKEPTHGRAETPGVAAGDRRVRCSRRPTDQKVTLDVPEQTVVPALHTL